MNSEVEEFLASFPYSEMTQDSYRRVLNQLVRLDLSQLTAAGLLSFVAKEEWGSSTRHVALCACRKYICWMYGKNHPALSARIKVIPTSPQPRLSPQQVVTLLKSFDLTTVAGIRDYALVCVALDSNLRASELCGLQLGNVHIENCKLFALTKGGQWKWKTFSEETAERIKAWVEVREPALGVQTLFVSFQRQRLGKPLTREGLQGLMKRWGKAVGFHVSPHMFRRSYASISTLCGAPKNVVKVGGGWKSDKVVDHYIGDLELEATRKYLPVKNLTTS